ncbi:MAG: HAMP domain-containing histidine kinase [Deltaproteobacteria bacterium]|nr:HAMP domain-containing histidine kinase [Deltaproteobacteria bacterium]
MRRRSLIFRYTLLHGTLFVLVLSGALAFLYGSTLSAHQDALDEEIANDARDLQGRLVGLSVREMAAVVTRTTSESHGRDTVYMLATETRKYVAGNIREWPNGVLSEGSEKLLEFPLPDAPAARARARELTLPAGQKLLVGRSMEERERFRTLIGRAFLAALLTTFGLAIGGGYVISRRVARRLDEINRNSEAILRGELGLRMPVRGKGDEFDELAGNLNRMLDRISNLMVAMREVTDDIAHDLRGPISRLRSRIEVALLGSHDEATYRETLEKTIQDADAILKVFNSLLTIAHAESGEPRARFAPVDLARIAGDAVEIYEPVAEEAGVALELEASSEPVTIAGDPSLLGQAIANLLDNAVKYVPRGGRVTVRVAAADGRARVSVADDGPGIPEAFRDKAFDRFSRLDESRGSPGSGLGLSLVRAVARLHEGEVSLGGAKPGLVVTLELPSG